MRIVLWISNEANQKALANRIHAVFPVSAIVTETRKYKRKLTLKKLVEKGIEKIFLRQISTAWYGMLLHFQKRYPEYPGVPRLDVQNINSDEVVLFTESHKPDLIVVSGTSLIKRKFLRVPVSTGIINLHTGLSPYIKGGPNCTNWCIATQQFHLIGNTVMWIDEGIDSGNLIATAVTPLDGNESLSGVHLKVMEHAHELYVKSIANISNGARTSVPQREIADGITYYNKEWGLLQKINLIRNIKKLRKAMKEKHPDDYKTVKTVDL